MASGVTLNGSTAIKALHLEDAGGGDTPKTTPPQTGMGKVSHPRRSGVRSMGGIVGMGLVTTFAALLLATSPVAAQTQGAALDADSNATKIEAEFRAPANAQWLKIDLKPEQVVVDRFRTGTQNPGQEFHSIVRGAVAANVSLEIPWPADAPRDFDKVGLDVFARDGEVSYKVDGDTLHLSYVSEKGLRAALQSNGGVFHLSNAQGDLHLLSVHADKLTFDDTGLKLDELRGRVPTLEEIVQINTASGHHDSAAEAAETLAGVKKQIADLESGATVLRSVY